MNTEQINSMVRSVLKLIGAALAAHGLTAYANIVNTEDVAGLMVSLVGLYLSHQAHTPWTLFQGGGPVQTAPKISINTGGGSPATPGTGAEPTAAPAIISSGEAPAGPAGEAPAGAREARALPETQSAITIPHAN